MSQNVMFDVSGYSLPSAIGNPIFQKIDVSKLSGVFIGNGNTVVLTTGNDSQYSHTFSTPEEATTEANLWIDRINEAR